MNACKNYSPARSVILSLSLALLLAGCKSTAPAANDDATLATEARARLTVDPALKGESIQVTAANGVVTLNGTVSSTNVRTSASAEVGILPGVRTVIDNLTVQPAPAQPAPAQTVPAQPEPVQPPPPAATLQATLVPPQKSAVPTPKPIATQKPSKPSPMVAQQQPAPQQQAAPIVRNTPAPAPQQAEVSAPVQPPPPPPAPVAHNITLPAGTTIPVRITQNLDSATSQTGDKFTGVIASDIIVDGLIVLPQGAPVTGHVDEVKDATHYKGSSLLTLSLTSISRRGERIDVATEAFSKQGEGRGKNTAEKVGGGAAVGAILGGIFGGGKGAAIGAAAGGGVGAGANTVTRGQQVQIPSETVVRFKLTDSILIHVTSGAGSSGNSGLERHSNQ